MKKTIKKTLIILSVITVFFAFILSSPVFLKTKESLDVNAPLAANDEYPTAKPTIAPTPILSPSPTPSPTPEPVFKEYDISLMALGDQLMHMAIVKTGIQADGSFDYSFLYKDLTDFIDYADIKVVNQETILAGNERGFSGYPLFNSPTEVGDAIAQVGFNVVLHATNHSADQGIDGLKNCASFWKKYPDISALGIHTTETYGEIPLLTIKGVTFALLNYTYSANSDTLNKNLMGYLDILCDYDRETGVLDLTKLNPQVLEDIKAARELADVVIVFPHWGNEYSLTPSIYQKQFATQMAEAGADLIIGTHPHVPQPVEWLTCEDGRPVLCFYSLGNYVSTQNRPETMLGGMAWVTFHVTENGVTIGKEPTGMLPFVCHYKMNTLRFQNIYLLEDYTEELAAVHGIQYYNVILTLSELQEECSETFGDMRLYRKDILPLYQYSFPANISQ